MSVVPLTIWPAVSRRWARQELPRGLDAIWDAAAGRLGALVPRTRLLLRRAAGVLAMEDRYSHMSDAALKEQAQQLKDIFRRGREARDDLHRAFAVIREVAFRQRGEKPFLVQVAGALAMESGCVAEMATGEGKTLTATMPATVAGWRGRGCHVITVNDYLAKRDAEGMGAVYRFCGLRAAHVEQGMNPAQRRDAYAADITYCTNKEVTADFLRDRLALGRLRGLEQAILAGIVDGADSGAGRIVQRGLHQAIVDEADSVLIDEAVTPLIISGDAPNPEQAEAFVQAAKLADSLGPEDYRLEPRYHEVDLTDRGRQRLAELAAPLGGLWHGARRREELIVQALTAKNFYIRGKQYVVQDDKIVIVDEFTGRLVPDREWRDGLHQAVTAREGLEVQPPKDTHARMSFQRFFRLYRRLAGMTGTAREAAREFWQIYHLPVVAIPTDRPCIRRKLPDRVHATEEDKWRAVVDEIAGLHRTGRPVLVGTRSVRASEHLSALLAARGLEHQVLNAVLHEQEAQVVAAAGQAGKITVATNMAGRGTDIKLGRDVAELGGLHVLATERHESQRVDRQLFGRSARQGDPGSAQAFVSLEDELLRRHAPHMARLAFRRHTSPLSRLCFRLAQSHAQRQARRQRKAVLHTDYWLDESLGFAGSEH